MSEQEQNLFNQVDQQLANHETATVLVERSNGDITTGRIETGMGVGRTGVFFGEQGKAVSNELLTDQHQEYLAQKLAGVALRSEIRNDYLTLLAGSDEEVAALREEYKVQDEQQRKDEWEAGRLERERQAADHKYNLARESGASHEEAEKSANRSYTQ